MKVRLFMSMAAAAMMLAGCSNDGNETIDNGPVQLRLTSGVTVQQTRAGYELDQQIKAGREVSVWVDDHAATVDKQLYGNNVLSVQTGGVLSGGTAMFYPQTGANVDIYAIHTNATLNGESFPTTITHAVADDQSDAGKYAPCDLLYAIRKDQQRQLEAVALKFRHLLSKVEVALQAGSGTPDLTGAMVTIENTKLKADFTPSKDADLNNAIAEEARKAAAALVTLTAIDNDAAPILIATKTTTNNFADGTEYAEAVVVPQTVATDAPFIKVKLASGGVLTYKIEDADGLKFESGKKYTFNITVHLSSLTVKTTVEQWIDGDAKEGEATM